MAGKILDSYGIDINDAANGIPIGHPRPHNYMHTAKCHVMVNNRPTKIVDSMTANGKSPTEIKAALLQELRVIGNETQAAVENSP
ncbi:AHH domain-containing protein [Paracoccus sp. 11-3]|uniref:AHH domain-containing protein n=1 Tax=Paracoccus amoyensis TaxID=2760093 RepID=A0A926GEC8_9RHOB|nr:AHH domain-containing protein [Paracoccus amoyensis]MBC9248496.1 AHH domain-containing protein [Paracoccus amoyensis]